MYVIIRRMHAAENVRNVRNNQVLKLGILWFKIVCYNECTEELLQN